jgi:DNA-binding NarL/FixJ family response regulator
VVWKRAVTPMLTRRVTRVAIVDDDYWALEGQRARLANVAGLEVVTTASHAEAAEWSCQWDDVDAAVIDAFDASETFDRFPGVGVVESVRRRRTSTDTTVIVVSGHMNNQLLKQRLFEAGADYLYHRIDIQTLDSLVAAITSPAPDRQSSAAEPKALRDLGLRPGSRPNAAIAAVRDANLERTLVAEMPQKSTDASRRALINLRSNVARHARLDGEQHSAATGNRQTPTWRETKRFLNRALGRDLSTPESQT